MSEAEQSHVPLVFDYFAIKFDCGTTIMLTEDAAHELWYQLHMRFKDRKYVSVLPSDIHVSVGA